jgi:hypothetical protein
VGHDAGFNCPPATSQTLAAMGWLRRQTRIG